MKSAIIINTCSPLYLQQAAEIKAFLQDNMLPYPKLELWLLYHQDKPAHFPQFEITGLHVELVPCSSPYLPEAFLATLSQLQEHKNMELLIFTSDTLGSELATRLAYRLHGSSAINVSALTIKNNEVAIEKSVYGNNLNINFTLNQPPFCVSIAKRPAQAIAVKPIEEQLIPFASEHFSPGWIIHSDCKPQLKENSYSNAPVVLAIGRGVSKSFIPDINVLAQKLGAFLGGSRPVIMNGWLSLDRMVGISGLRLNPELTIVIGASGAAAFAAGVTDSQCVIAINHDPNARVFTFADVAIIDDAQAIITELISLIDANT